MRKFLIALLACLTCLSIACGDEPSEDPENEQTHTLTLTFDAVVDEASFECGQTYALGSESTEVSFTEMKLFVSEFELVDADGETHAATLVDDGMWSNGNVALLDFEDASGSCSNGTEPVNKMVELEVPPGDYTGVRFTLGVPFTDNHQNAAVADAPLNLTTMFWSWNGGYKFVRIDGRAGSGQDTGGFRFHLGSTGCEMEDGTQEVSSCSTPNRARVELDGIDPASSTIAFDLERLFEDTDFTPVDGDSINCQASPMHEVCGSIFPALGLGFLETPAQAQRVFEVR